MKQPEAPIAPLTAVQAKNYAVMLQEAIVSLGRSSRLHAAAMPPVHAESMQSITQSLERLYWQTKHLEAQAHHALSQSLTQGDAP